jgi:hypothetical protein
MRVSQKKPEIYHGNYKFVKSKKVSATIDGILTERELDVIQFYTFVPKLLKERVKEGIDRKELMSMMIPISTVIGEEVVDLYMKKIKYIKEVNGELFIFIKVHQKEGLIVKKGETCSQPVIYRTEKTFRAIYDMGIHEENMKALRAKVRFVKTNKNDGDIWEIRRRTETSGKEKQVMILSEKWQSLSLYYLLTQLGWDKSSEKDSNKFVKMMSSMKKLQRT